MGMRRFLAGFVASGLLSLLLAASASGAVGGLTQKAGTAGCVSDNGSAGACADVTGISDPHAIVISPDGTSAYSASFSDDAIAIFDRNPSTGALTQLKGLRKGTHRFSVVAVDAAGNTDPTAATDGFKVKRKKRSP